MATIGYKYYFGIHMGLCRGPIDELVEIKVGERTAWFGSAVESTQIDVNNPKLFGGFKKEGGVDGPLDLMMGEPTQVAPAGLVAMLGGPLPGYRGMCTAFFDGEVSSMNPYPKPWKFRIRRGLKGWEGAPFYPERAIVELTGEPPPEGNTVSTSSQPKREVQSFNVPDEVGVNAVLTITPVWDGTVTQIERVVRYIPGNSEPYMDLEKDTDYSWNPASPNEIEMLTDLWDNVTVEVTFKYIPGEVTPNTVDQTTIKAMNPAHIIYETLTNRAWGRGLPATDLDSISFRASAETLFNEGFGMCIRWTRQDSIESFLQSILDHIGAVIYTDNLSAKLVLKLIRGDYVLGELPLLDVENGILEITESSVVSTGTAVNEVRVTYRDPITDKDRTVKADNLASLQATGGAFKSIHKQFPGIPTPGLALRVAQRELRVSAITPRRFNLTLDRRAWATQPGSVIRIRDLGRNIPDMALRVSRVERGTLRDGRIKIIALQDVFSLPNVSYVGSEPPQWVPPTLNPCVGPFQLMEVPYAIMKRRLAPAEFALVDDNSAWVGVVMGQGQPLNAGYDVMVRPGLPTVDDDPPDGSSICA